MKHSFLLIAILTGLSSFSQLEKRMAEEAGKQYTAGNYAKADSLYDLSLSSNPEWLEATFNKGDALYRGGDFDGAAEQFTKIASKAQDKKLKSEAFHNLGNTHMSKQEFDKAAAAYRNALINDPKDEDARYNLAYAQKMLQQQQEQQEQNQDGEEQQDGEENDEKQDSEGDQNKDGENKDNQEGENDQGDQKPEDKEGDKPQEQQGDQQEQEGEQAQPLQLSPEEASRILESLKQDERKVQTKVQQQKGKGKKVKTDKDW